MKTIGEWFFGGWRKAGDKEEEKERNETTTGGKGNFAVKKS